MRPRLVQFLDAALRYSPVQLGFALSGRDDFACLAYHGVDDPRAFAAHMDYLAKVRRPVSLDDLLQHVGQGRPLPRGAVLVTFDDGDRSVLEVAAPILRSRGIPAVVFVIAGLLGGARPPWWEVVRARIARGERLPGHGPLAPAAAVRLLKAMPDAERRGVVALLEAVGEAPSKPQLTAPELLELERSGIAVGNHTLSHPSLPRCADAVLAAEIGGAHRLLEEALGHAPRAFAYPYGDWDKRAEREVLAHGYRAAFLFDHRACVTPLARPLAISRLMVDSTAGMNRLRIIMSGLHPALVRARGRRE